MRCEEVIRELAVPTDDRDSATLSEHLATCPPCADWANRAAQLDRLWEATRPIEPAPEIWDTVWAGVASSLHSPTSTKFAAFSLPMASSNGSMARVESPAGLTHSSSRSRRWNWAAIGLIGFAQAAAVFFALSLTRRAFPTGVEIEEGRVVVIHVEGSTAKVIDLTPQGSSYRLEKRLRNLESVLVDDWYVMFNEVESMPKQTVAMKE